MTTKAENKPEIVGVPLEEGDVDALKALCEKTGLSRADVARRAIRFAVPIFDRGEANLLDYAAPIPR